MMTAHFADRVTPPARVRYLYAQVYAQWGRPAEALEWLETAVRLRNPCLSWLKVDALLDPLRKEPRFQAIEGTLKFRPT